MDRIGGFRPARREVDLKFGFGEIAIDLRQARLWITSVWPTNRELSPLWRSSKRLRSSSN